MYVRSPELFAEYNQGAFGEQLHGEFVDREVESHARRDAEQGGKTKARRADSITGALLEDRPLDGDLGLRVQRHRPEVGALVHEAGRVRHPAVVAAGRREGDAT